MVPIVLTLAMDDQEAGTSPHRLGFPERSIEVREVSRDQPGGMVERRPLRLMLSEVRVVRLVQERGSRMPLDRDLRGTMSGMSEMSNSDQRGQNKVLGTPQVPLRGHIISGRCLPMVRRMSR